jgi:hypothetical protein
MLMKKLLLSAFAAATVIGSANSATAAPFVLELSTVVSGATPGGITPYLSLEFEDVGAGIVEVTFNAANLVLSEFATEWNFNLNPLFVPENLVINHVSGLEAGSFGTDANGFNAAAGSDNYDIQFKFPTAGNLDRLGPDGDFAVYTFSLAGLTAAAFNFTNAADANGPNYYTMAHIQGTAASPGSSWVGAQNPFNEDLQDPPTPAPEPASFALLGLGGAMLLARRYLARK